MPPQAQAQTQSRRGRASAVPSISSRSTSPALSDFAVPQAAEPSRTSEHRPPDDSSSHLGHATGHGSGTLGANGASQGGPGGPDRKRSRGSTTLSQKGSRGDREGTDDGENDPGGSKRKKRIPQSCSECQRRRIKCDRQQPCSACVRRKRTQYCSFEDEDPESPYALASEVRAINRRLVHLETLLQQTASPASVGLAPTHPTGPSPSALPAPHERLDGTTSRAGSISRVVDPRSPSHSDTESAVADIEEAAFGARVPVLRAITAAAQGNARRYNYAGHVDMELTEASTSILAEPLTFDQDGRPRSAVRLGLDLAVSTADLPSVRHDALAQILAVLPGPEISGFLIAKYFAEIEWDFKVLDPYAFPLEHRRYNEMLEQGREDSIDPLWIACFCMVLALSLEGFWSRPNGMKDLSLFRGLDEEGLKDLPSVWHDAALRALQLGEYGGTPRIRTIQCVILFGQYIQISSSSGQNGRFLGWFASAVRIAQRLGLHRLGHGTTMPPDDPALPPGANALKRELAVRLFHHLVNIDSFLSDSPSFRCYLLHPSQYNTFRPLNVNLSDVSRSDARPPPAAPLSVYTDASYQLVQCRIAEQVRATLDNFVLSGRPFSYPAVVEQDRAFESVLSNVPAVFAWSLSAPLPSARIAYERACLHEEVSSRIIRLNRPLLGRGYQVNSVFHHSTQQCIKYARRLISSNFDLLAIAPSLWMMYTGTLASSLVLMMDLFHAIDTDEPEIAIREKREILAKARAIFETRVATPALEVVVEEGRKILAALLQAEEARRTTRAAYDMLPSEQPVVLETFAQVLKRVSRELAADDNSTKPLPARFAPSGALSPSLPLRPSQTSQSPYPATSFARSAATAMTAHFPPPFAFTPAAPLPPPAFENDAEGGFGDYLNLLESQDWTATGFGSPSGDATSLLGQLAATW